MTIFFVYEHLSFSNHALNCFVCSRIKCHNSHQVSYHSYEATILRCKFLSVEMAQTYILVLD